MGSCGRWRAAGPKITLPLSARSKVDWWHGQSRWWVVRSFSEIVADQTPEGEDSWTYEGILCFSKICTHVGCALGLYEQLTHHMLCPCHQSTFDLADNGKVIFGPAARHLPQLPIEVDDEGYIVAQSDFTEPVGPSFWERDNTEREDAERDQAELEENS